MREIKFRLPIKCNKCQEKGFEFWGFMGQKFEIIGSHGRVNCYKNDHPIEISGEPEQFTGLKDKSWRAI